MRPHRTTLPVPLVHMLPGMILLGQDCFVFSAASNRTVPHCLYQPAPNLSGIPVHRGQQFFFTAFFRCTNWRISSENKLYSFPFVVCFFLACVPFARAACQVEEKREKKKILGGALFIAHTPQVSFLSHRLASLWTKKYIYTYEKRRPSHLPLIGSAQFTFSSGLPGRSHTSLPGPK